MDNIKEMPYEEKYAIVMDNINDTFALEFVTNNIGQDAAVELKIIWGKGIKPIPENAPSKERYEAAYSNWIWKSKSTLSWTPSLGQDRGRIKRESCHPQGV